MDRQTPYHRPACLVGDVDTDGDLVAHILRQIKGLGYAIECDQSIGQWCRVTAVGHGQRYEVSGDDPYGQVCELAEMVGIDLRDG